MTSSGDVAAYKGSTGMVKWQTGGSIQGRGPDTAVTLAGRINRNRKWLAVLYRTAYDTDEVSVRRTSDALWGRRVATA